MREQFLSLYELLHDASAQEHRTPDHVDSARGDQLPSNSQNDTVKFQEDKEFSVGHDTKLTFWWTNSAFLAPPHLHPTSTHAKTAVIYMSMYLADYGSYFRGVPAFADAAADSTRRLQAAFPSWRVIWHLPHALHPGVGHQDWRIMNGWQQQVQMRAALRDALLQRSSSPAPSSAPTLPSQPLGLLDPWDLTLSKAALTKDGNHYWVKGEPLGGQVVSTKTQILLNLLCRSVSDENT